MLVGQEADLTTYRRPYLLGLDPGGRAAWKEFTDRHAEEVNAEEFPDHLRGPWSKLRGYCGRLALIIHCLRCAADELDSGRADVDGASLRAAAQLVDYFKGQARRVHAAVESNTTLQGARKYLGWIRRERPTTFKRHKAMEDLRSDKLFPTPESMDEALAVLAHHNIIRELPPPVRQGSGRKPAPTYAVNPLALAPENPVNPGNGGGRP
jgi:hypothetical protein